MKNPAVQDLSQINVFTQHVAQNPGCEVLLRNGRIVQPLYKEAEDEFCEDCFHTDDWGFCWNVNGKSVTNSDLDMMELV